MTRRGRLVQLGLVLVGCSLIVAETTSVAYLRPRTNRRDAQSEVSKPVALGDWDQAHEDVTIVDTDIMPDYWEPHLDMLELDHRVPTNGAEPPEQLVKVTDRKHKFPVFATICSLAFLATIITLLIVCTS
ncbi:hypothetical protein F441_06046 [Phytophthora nicotianae CJ01A1]|uniref:RxLR effector protein n=6 Tax=Phytophthora nicotianae TaxID=4792 RepID=W2Y079_PHYNI|nr:hypothetical protein PPTG_02183 [Phytophthora nicotianae INRA-310]ETI50411.1 hypothetical protein F443_06032 [Phytophthora nicotianae P1569]ETK90288.1 hypothetical protein L915_05912 [Phytophthora nicotianae]ETO79146.1 hypothetical protein F444_06087 [Phytophthora nicotianae P1976]ETP20174.1 hypothetical protein F441_06046 [Phytophthora nicotianae CJ01A1]ETP28048.1 hypothetical protein F442_22670 [Phytophthora nicotianae P10297]KUF81744.1 hypothetical protein AM587_10006396 [Phytophthora n